MVSLQGRDLIVSSISSPFEICVGNIKVFLINTVLNVFFNFWHLVPLMIDCRYRYIFCFVYYECHSWRDIGNSPEMVAYVN